MTLTVSQHKTPVEPAAPDRWPVTEWTETTFVWQGAPATHLQLDQRQWPLSAAATAPPGDADLGVGQTLTLKLPFAVGALPVAICAGDHVLCRGTLDCQPAGHKLSPDAWGAMLADVQDFQDGLAIGADATQAGHVQSHGMPSRWLAAATLPLVPQLVQALTVLLRCPLLGVQDVLHDVPLHQTRTVRAETLAWLSRHPDVAAWLDPSRTPALATTDLGTPPVVPVPSAVDTLAHPANRHVAWLVGRVVQHLQAAAQQLASVPDTLNQSAAWATSRAAALQHAADALWATWRDGPLARVHPRAPTPSSLLVVQGHATYRRVNRLAQRLLHTALADDPSDLTAHTRPSFDLYELWTFARMSGWLQDALQPMQLSWRWTGRANLLQLGKQHPEAALTGQAPGLRVSLAFQPRFGGYVNKKPDKPYSLSSTRRPDLVLTVQTEASAKWVVLDAKYSGSEGGIGKALQSAHLYHHALRQPLGPLQDNAPQALQAAGALLLAPAIAKGAEVWSDPDFWQAHGIGAVALHPQHPVPATLTAWLATTLGLPCLHAPEQAAA